MKRLLISLVLAIPLLAQQTTRWAATTGQVTVTTSYTATVQQPTSNTQAVLLDQIMVYCSAACTVSQAANGAAATATAGTVTPILPAPLNTPMPFTFWTASNVGAGTVQGGTINVAAGAYVMICLTQTCGATGQVQLGNSGAASNYSATITMPSGTGNITFYGRVQQ